MPFSQNGDRIILDISRDEYEQIILALGIASGVSSREGERRSFWRWIYLANVINEGNPGFTPYEIPGEYLENFKLESPPAPPHP